MHSTAYYNDDYFVNKLLQINVENIEDPAEKFNYLLDGCSKYQTLHTDVEHYKKLYEEQVECTAKLLNSCNDKQATINELTENINQQRKEFLSTKRDDILELTDDFTQKVNDLAEDYTQKVNDLADDYKEKLDDNENEYKEKLDQMQTEYEQKIRERDDEITKLRSTMITTLCKLNAPQALMNESVDFKKTQDIKSNGDVFIRGNYTWMLYGDEDKHDGYIFIYKFSCDKCMHYQWQKECIRWFMDLKKAALYETDINFGGDMGHSISVTAFECLRKLKTFEDRKLFSVKDIPIDIEHMDKNTYKWVGFIPTDAGDYYINSTCVYAVIGALHWFDFVYDANRFFGIDFN